MIPFLDLGAAYRELKEELDAAYGRIMASGRYILGEEVEAFEEEWAAYCGVKYCVGVGSGLDALHLALRAMGVGPGDEVIVPSNTYIATWLAATSAGAVPVPVEATENSCTLEPSLLERAITSRSRAIIPVHLYGRPADMTPIMEVARRHGLRVLEDAAQAHGASYGGRRAGGLGDAAGWSFYPTKNLGAFGDGGAVTTDDSDLADKVRVLRNYGSRVRDEHEIQGYNSRLDPLQAAFLRVKLRHLDAWNARRRALAAFYCERLAGIEGLMLPPVVEASQPCWHLFVVRHSQRDRLQAHLARRGVESLVHYPLPPHRSAAYAAEGFARRPLPVADRLAAAVLSIPLGPQMTSEQCALVAEAVADLPAGSSG